MLQAATFFGAGLLVKEGCTQLPACSASKRDGGPSFKLSVHVHHASVPGLGRPGAVLRLRPRLAVGFGGAWKETEFADFAGGGRELDPTASFPQVAASVDHAEAAASSGHSWMESTTGCSSPSSSSGAKPRGALFTIAEPAGKGIKGHPSKCSSGVTSRTTGDLGCPWRFGDTLTFSPQLRDLVGGGLRLRLSAQSDMVLGPWQVEIPRNRDFGEAVVNLQQRVLPACAPAMDPGMLGKIAHGDEGDRLLFGGGGRLYDDGEAPVTWWESPVLVVPLLCVSESPHSGMEVRTVARVALSFRVNADPKVLLREAEDAVLTVSERFERAVDQLARWMQAPVTCASCGEPGLDCAEASVTPRYQACKPEGPRGPLGPEDEPEAEAAPFIAAPAAVADWAFKL